MYAIQVNSLSKQFQKFTAVDDISFTVIVSEMKDNIEVDRRGLSTVIHIV